MLTLLYAPDGTASWSGAGVLTLCNTTRSLTEMDIKFNHSRIIQTESGFGSAAKAFFDNQNWQNSLSLRVRRGVDFSAVAFPDPEGAFSFALQQPTRFPTTGNLQIKLVGTTTNTTLYLLNCALEGLNLADWLGTAPSFEYNFVGGLVSLTSPF